MRKLISISAVAIAVLALVPAVASAAGSYVNSASYTGQGLNSNPDGFGGYDLNTELCGVENGADADGPYLLFVMTATGAKNADITFPSGTNAGTHAMTKSGGGAFKYIAQWDDPDALLASGISGTYDGKAKNVQLVVSHGCRPFVEEPVWCSPGFWKNAKETPGVKPNGSTYPGAWPLTGHTKADLFNQTVVPSFYDTASVADPTLGTVLSTPGANTFGAESAPYGLNAFNATGAYLTDSLDGYSFSTTDYAAHSDTCPVDSFGNLKEVVAPV
jgi:hypothetical protein